MTKTMRRSVADSTGHDASGILISIQKFALLSRLSFFLYSYFCFFSGASLDLSTASIHDTEGQMIL